MNNNNIDFLCNITYLLKLSSIYFIYLKDVSYSIDGDQNCISFLFNKRQRSEEETAVTRRICVA